MKTLTWLDTTLDQDLPATHFVEPDPLYWQWKWGALKSKDGTGGVSSK